MRTIRVFAILLSLAAVTLVSCSKDPGFGGKAMIFGTVALENGDAAEGAIVKIKFDATEATTDYDFATVADAQTLTRGVRKEL